MSVMRKNEQGVVSILVTMIMIIVITLIVIGFAQITRRNQRESLDTQLSTQAYYAAESGVNAAVNYLTNPTNIGAQINTIGNCTTFIGYLGSAGVNNLDTATKTSYNCLMVNTEPTSLNISPVTQNLNSIVYVANTDKEAFNALNFQWTQQTSTNFPGGACKSTGGSGTTLPQMNAWKCPYGILRVDLVDSSNISNASLQGNQGVMSYYFVPSYTSGNPFVKQIAITWPTPSVEIVPVSCTTTCSIELNIAGGSKQYFARLTIMYQDSSSLTITGGDATHPLNLVTGTGTNFVGGQALIDSTGQSQDELRRVQVRIPLTTTANTLPAYGLQTTDTLCKELSDGPAGSGISTTDSCPNHP
jgi:Tfp pilus assembly protein PilX